MVAGPAGWWCPTVADGVSVVWPGSGTALSEWRSTFFTHGDWPCVVPGSIGEWKTELRSALELGWGSSNPYADSVKGE